MSLSFSTVLVFLSLLFSDYPRLFFSVRIVIYLLRLHRIQVEASLRAAASLALQSITAVLSAPPAFLYTYGDRPRCAPSGTHMPQTLSSPTLMWRVLRLC
ncbi:hypothetical protein C8R47DRAFT_1129922 [Mycena vitilis]|nr:hypothetical protein C8R47DRAFT_1129922 [Mycena vitilis]